MKTKPKKLTKVKGTADAVTETLNYLLHIRGEQPTTAAETAKHFHITGAAAGQRLSRLVALGQAEKLKRGLFRARKFSLGPSLPASTDPIGDLLAFLYAERDRLDIRIKEAERTRELQQQWIRSKQRGAEEKR